MREGNALKILLVENNESIRSGLAAFLRSQGFDVTETVSSEAMSCCEIETVVAGYTLPENELAELVATKKDRHPGSPVIVLVKGTLDLPFSCDEIEAINIRERTGELLSALRERTRQQNNRP